MSEENKFKPGNINWIDLTVPEAENLRDFYSEVVGWKFVPVNMGDYQDFTMVTPGDDQAVAGICHARGGNVDLPPQWLIYINVSDIEASLQKVSSLGGTVLSEPRTITGYGRFCVIQDPAGAVAALFEPGQK